MQTFSGEPEHKAVFVSPYHLLEKVGPHASGFTASPEVKLEKVCIDDSLENHLQHISMHFLELKRFGL